MRATLLRRLALPAALASIVLFDISCGNDSGSPTPTPTDLIVTPGADTLISVGETRTFTAQVLDANGHPIDAATVTWSSSAPGVLSVEPTTGVATAVANGSAQVKATSGTLQGAANVIVAQIVASVTVTPANVAFTAVGDTARFTAVAKDAGGTPVVGAQILWSVSDNTVATIDTLGLAKAKGPGTALVSAQAQTRAGYASVGVDPTVTQFVILGAPDSAVAGDPIPAALQVELRDAKGNRVMNSSLSVTVAPAGAAAGTPLHGTTTVLADQGRATFANLWFEKAGLARFRVSVAALPVDSASLVTVVPAAPARVRADPLAPTHIAGVPIGLVARVEDRFANPATNFVGSVRVRNLIFDGIGQLFGDTVVDAVAGVATFADLNLHKSNPVYQFTLALPGLGVPLDTTDQVAILSSTATQLVLVHTGPVSAPFGRGGDSTVLVLSDSFGNRAGGDTALVSVAPVGWAFSAPPGHELAVNSGDAVAVINGEATFNLGVTRPGRARFAFSAPGLAPDTTSEIIIDLPTSFWAAASDAATCLNAFFCSGDNTHGELGVDPGTIPHDSLFLPHDSGFGGNTSLIDGGGRHFCAVVDSFLVPQVHTVCWGDNSDGQLGGGTVGGGGPQHVSGPSFTSITSISAGAAHTCVIGDGTTVCWGKNDQGQLGTGSIGGATGTPGTVTGGHTFTKVSAGGRHTCALDDSNHIWCWGANDYGQLGDSGASGTQSGDPVEVHSNKTFFDVAAGEDFTCASALGGANQEVWCWGRNDARQLGPQSGDTSNHLPVKAFAEVTIESGALGAGAKFACVTFYDGVSAFGTYCWGANDHGQLGRGTVTPYDSIPQQTTAIDISKQIGAFSMGRDFACGLNLEPGVRWVCWGRNDLGQFGSGKVGDSSTPLIIQDQY